MIMAEIISLKEWEHESAIDKKETHEFSSIFLPIQEVSAASTMALLMQPKMRACDAQCAMRMRSR